MKKLSNIIKSKLIDGADLPEWYELRLDICNTCEFNSVNIDKSKKSVARKGWEIFAGAHCTKCGCTVVDKTKLEEESCPENRWCSRIEVDPDKLYISTNSRKVRLTYNLISKRYEVEYGEIPYQYDSSVVLVLEDKDIINLKVASSCGCTTATPKKVGTTTEIEIKYDTKRVGKFGKNVTLSYGEKDKRLQTIINIKGIVQNKR